MVQVWRMFLNLDAWHDQTVRRLFLTERGMSSWRKYEARCYCSRIKLYDSSCRLQDTDGQVCASLARPINRKADSNAQTGMCGNGKCPF